MTDKLSVRIRGCLQSFGIASSKSRAEECEIGMTLPKRLVCPEPLKFYSGMEQW
ncbi:hypothetical protein YGAWVPHU_CDS0051 [Salmonella phage SeKF_13]|uniref:Uncharacterized protein n=1 Tax=Erwinia phage Harbringer TaxID=3158978 RepID=A0AAU8EJR4_9CAUD